MTANYTEIDDTVFPNLNVIGDIEWQLRYGKPTRTQMIIAADFLSAYKVLLQSTQKHRNRICKKLMEVQK